MLIPNVGIKHLSVQILNYLLHYKSLISYHYTYILNFLPLLLYIILSSQLIWSIFNIVAHIWQETRELWTKGLVLYFQNMWNFIDFTRNSLYVGTAGMRLLAYFQVRFFSFSKLC